MLSRETLSLPPNTITPTSLHVQDHPIPNPNSNPAKKKRNLPGTPDPDAEVVALSPKSLMATNRFMCEICKKGFQRDQNLQLHRRGHNLPWKLRQRTNKDQVRKKVYVCPEKSCVHHDPSRALGDLTGIKKHFSRKHGEKKWKCHKCSKKYAVQSDWKAHTKICGTREYKCDCGTLFSRKDSFITHRAFCDALAEERARKVPASLSNMKSDHHHNHLITNAVSPKIPQNFSGFQSDQFGGSGSLGIINYGDTNHGQQQKLRLPLWLDQANSHYLHPLNNNFTSEANTTMPEMDVFGSQWVNYRYQEASFANIANNVNPLLLKQEQEVNKGELTLSSSQSTNSSYLMGNQNPMVHMSATTQLQKAVQMGSSRINHDNNKNNVVEVHKLNDLVSVEGDTNLGGGYLLNDSNKSFVGVSGSKGLDNHMVMPVDEETTTPSILGKRLRSINYSNNSQNQLGLTRDFMGVGDEEDSIRRVIPFSGQDLVEFNTMGSASAMNLQSQYSGHYC
ncbi:hypothetical protein RJT34_29914 [Clitoria ternatea]|uniref:C2H2-type domain-containing protein n=1 Tax=Clitoria ternatea TaxID=43366 RepID=A0AAN9I6U6_CLITE